MKPDAVHHGGAVIEREAVFAPAPFTPEVVRVAFPAGATIAQLLTKAINVGVLDVRDLERTDVFVNGLRLEDRAAALDFVPQPDDVVNVAVTVHGGGSRGNKAMQMVLQIALIAAATYIGGPMAGQAVSKFGRVALKVAAAAIAAGGQMAIQSMFAKKPESAGAVASYSLSGQSNTARQRKSMPLVLGEGRVVFDLASSAFTTIDGDDTYLTAIFGLHYGPCQVKDIKFGETLVSSLAAGEVQLEYFLTPGPRNSALYPMRVVESAFSDELKFTRNVPDPWVVKTTAEDADQIEIDVGWLSGLGFTKSNSSSFVSQEVRGTVEYSPAGEDNWTRAPLDRIYYDRHGAALPQGDWYVQAKSRSKPVRRTFRFKPPAKGKYDVRMRAWDPDSDDPDASTYTTTWTGLRTIENRPALIDETLSVVVARFKASSTVNGQIPPLTGVVTPIVPVLDENDEWTGDPAVYSEAWQPSSNGLALARYICTGYPAARPMRADQVDASLATAYRLAEEYDWSGSIHLTDEVSLEEALTRIGYMSRASFYWNGRALCAVSDWEKPAPKQMFAGRNAKEFKYARSFPDEIHGVVVAFDNLDEDNKRDELPPIYMPGYSRDGGLVDGVETRPAEILDSYTLAFSATPDRAYREGRVYLAKRLYQSESFSWTSGADAVISTFGDRVLVRHVSTLFGESDTFVQNRWWTGDLIAGVRLEDPVEMEEGVLYALDVRRPGREAIRGLLVATQPGSSRDLYFASPLQADEAPSKGDFVAFGRVDVITEDVELVDFAPSSSREVRLQAQTYRFADLQAAETGPIPPLQTKLSVRDRAPRPLIVSAFGDPAGAIVNFSVLGQRTSPIVGFSARWRSTPTEADPSPAWSSLEPLDADQRQLVTQPFSDAQNTVGDVDAEYRIDIEIRSALANGDVSEAGVVSGLLIDRGVPEPTAFQAGAITRTAPDGSKYPVLSVSAEPITTGLVQDLVVEKRLAGGSDGDWVSAGHALPAAAPYGDFRGVLGGETLDVSAYWRTSDGWRSPRVVRTNLLVPAGSTVSSDVVNAGGRPILDVLGDLDQTMINQAATDTRTAVWKSQTDEVQGSQGTSIDQLAAQTAQNTAYITFMRQVDAATGAAKWVMATNVNGHVSGIVQTNDGTLGEIYFAEDIFGIVGTDPNNPKKVFYVNTVTGKVGFRADVEIDGNLHVAGTVQTAAAADNAWTAMQVSSASSTTYGSNTEVTHFTQTLTLEDDADVLFLAQINFQDGGGNSESYHSAATRIYLDGELLDQNSQGKNNAVTALPVLTSRRLLAGTHTVQLRSMCKPDDYYTSRTLVTFRAYR